MILAGDIGGTKTSLAVIDPDRGMNRPVIEGTLPSTEFSGLEMLVKSFLEGKSLNIKSACFGVAGPVVNGSAKITNLPWRLCEDDLAKSLDLTTVRLINDLQAIGFSIPHLAEKDLHTLSQGEPEHGGTIAIIAPGTGLGEGFMIWDGERYRAYSSEGGHTDFAPRNPDEVKLLAYCQEKIEHVSFETLCSGIGIPNIYEFLKNTALEKEPPELADLLSECDDPTPVIMNNAMEGEKASAICRRTLKMFVSMLGSEAGNMALKVLATGGVYIGGGIPPRILDALNGPEFMNAFLAKGRMVNLMSKMPVHVILQPKAALIGAAYVGMETTS